MTTPVAGAPTSAQDTVNTGKARLSESFDTFINLLTTQLKNQDPLSPLDSNQFTQQLVQMTGVEQQLATNDLLTKLVANTGNGVATAISLIGKQVRAVSDDAGLVGGSAKWTYNLPDGAADVKIEVLDANKKVVHAESATDTGRTAGDHAFSWDGTALNGSKLPDGGVYTLRITATDAAGKAITATNYVDGVVNSVEQSATATLISVNGAKIDWQKVANIGLAPTTTH